MRVWRTIVRLTVGAVVLGGCAAPQVNAGAFLEDSLRTVETVNSEVSTSEMTLRSLRDGDVFISTANVIVTQADESLGETALAYASVEPPASQDQMRADVLVVTLDAQNAVWAGLVAIRRGDSDGLSRAIAEMTEVKAEIAELTGDLESAAAPEAAG